MDNFARWRVAGFVMAMHISAAAQDPSADSLITRSLDEVVVETAAQRLSPSHSVYVPQAAQKEAAHDAVSLLSLMAIPQIDVDPVAQAVRTAAGRNVELFIDFLPATSQDLKGMRTQDVVRVEYWLHPKDPRFQGAEYAVNFIMQKYEWGGYTKLVADKWLGVNRTEGSVYSKMAHKSMVYDVYAGEIYLTDRHGGNVSSETFRFDDLHGNGPQTVCRTAEVQSALYRNSSTDFALRAVYDSDRMRLSSRVSCSLEHVPHDDATSSLAYSTDLFAPSEASSRSSSRNWSFGYKGNGFLKFSPKLSLQARAGYVYGHNRRNATYEAGHDFSIVNNAREDSHRLSLRPSISWTMNDKNSLLFSAHTVQGWNFVDYGGSSPSRQKYNIGVYGVDVEYELALDKWNIGAEAGWMWESNHISDTRMSDNFPHVYAYATYSPTDKHQIEAGWYYSKEVPEASQKSPNMLRQDELMWMQGNPRLADFARRVTELSYTWLPSSTWQFAATALFYNDNDRCVTTYAPEAPDGMMLRRYDNSGTFHTGMMSASATAKLFGGKLTASLRPQYWMRKTTGPYYYKSDEVTCVAKLACYLGKLHISGWYVTPSRYPDQESGVVTRSPSSYRVEAGWSSGGWNIRASAYNFMRSSWEESRETLDGQYYGFDRRVYSTAKHWRVSLAATYTIGYGKKVKRGDEVDGAEKASSAIFK